MEEIGSKAASIPATAVGSNGKVINLGTFLCLYISQFVPQSFLMTALQVTMRQGHYDLQIIGLLHLVRLPWLLKFLWSPYIDRHCLTVADYKKTIISTELVYAIALFCTGLFDVKTDLLLILILFFISMMASATQDIATDALAILSFKKHDQSLVNSMQSMGSFGGTLVGGGLLLMVLHRYGWNVVVPCLGMFVICMLIPLVLNKNIKIQEDRKSKERARPSDFIWFFSRRSILPQLGFLVLFYMGIIGILSTVRPFLVDQGYDMKEIGFLTGILGTSVSFVMAWFSGVLVRKVGIAKARFAIAALIVVGPLYFLLTSFLPFNIVVYVIGMLYIKACYGLATVVVYTSAMQMVRPGREGTDFTIQVVITHLSGLLIAVASGSIGKYFDYQGVYVVETVIALLSFIYVAVLFRPKKGTASAARQTL
jgi:hypothetical protein